MNSMMFLQAAGGSGMGNLVFFGGILAVFYLFMIRPQVKKQKDQRTFSDNIAKGDEVVTNSGIVGKVNKIEDNMIIIESSKSYLKILSSSVSKELTESLNPSTAPKKKGIFGF